MNHSFSKLLTLDELAAIRAQIDDARPYHIVCRFDGHQMESVLAHVDALQAENARLGAAVDAIRGERDAFKAELEKLVVNVLVEER